MLRAWQQECSELVLSKFETANHFLCLACPGAGKSIMAANVAEHLFRQGKIDYVVCFSPSRSVAESLKGTFEKIVGRRINGRIGSVGVSLTYQSLLYSGDQLLDDLSSNKVLVVFDEIHHCSGDNVTSFNSWGAQLVDKIQHLATFTLSLTGTPWRTDMLPISFAQYADPEGNIICDYVYGLTQAVRDGVCRKPNIVILDVDQASTTDGGKNQYFYSINELIKETNISYQDIITNNKAILEVLKRAVEKLAELRCSIVNSGGLVVASSISHAQQIKQILEVEYEQTVSIVTYQHDDALDRIQAFRQDNTQWIVSIAMISEGTDIPRLQVCCHLSDVTTELYFRQILGRILRVTDRSNNQAWLYTMAESNLVGFSERLNLDVPDCYVKSCQDSIDGLLLEPLSTFSEEKLIEPVASEINPILESSILDELSNFNLRGDVISLERFKERIISSFEFCCL
ncbi:hypothetical protein TW85_14350 [Marinomonas sp. S3726]|uniref:DEAD/DEAH box helicase n=1 Tax=Marinomonas sp. S3726 TaxID=579484 RepID=UPI0005F9B0A8|nr:DEAD/DEAH box helicase family protein [Marinomonas sp. S3726]KJZ12798.1 hypothetical protein TW85_14350 [Marinomonas sp. S3726]